MVDLLVLAADHAEARKFAGAGASASDWPHCTPHFTINRATTPTSPDARSLRRFTPETELPSLLRRGSGNQPGSDLASRYRREAASAASPSLRRLRFTGP